MAGRIKVFEDQVLEVILKNEVCCSPRRFAAVNLFGRTIHFDIVACRAVHVTLSTSPKY